MVFLDKEDLFMAQFSLMIMKVQFLQAHYKMAKKQEKVY